MVSHQILKISVIKFVIFAVIVQAVMSPMQITSVESTFLSQGNILFVGGSGEGNYSKIQSAIENASDGDTVFVFSESSPYVENIYIDKEITIEGENRFSTVIDGAGSGTVVTIVADGVHFMNFTVQGCGGSWPRSGIIVYADDTIIETNRLTNNVIGIYLHPSKHNKIIGNHIFNNRYHGIRVEYSLHTTIRDNVITNNDAYGIYFWESSTAAIYNTTVENNQWGGIILGDNSCDILVYHNNLVNNLLSNAYDECGNIWDNGYPSGGNYWSDYNGTDNNGDGIGDTPYVIPGSGSQDNYPLIKPYPQNPIVLQFLSPLQYHLYIGKICVSFPITLIFGPINVSISAISNSTSIQYVEFYVNHQLLHVDENEPFSWFWNEPAFFKQHLKIVAYDSADYTKSKELIVRKFF